MRRLRLRKVLLQVWKLLLPRQGKKWKQRGSPGGLRVLREGLQPERLGRLPSLRAAARLEVHA